MMPMPQTQEQEQQQGETYEVQQGDTWDSIAADLGVDVQALQEANPDIQEPQPGDVLNVPDTETETEDTAGAKRLPAFKGARGLPPFMGQ